MLIAILGRLPKLSLAELENYFGSDKIQTFSPNSAIITQDQANINQFGGVLKFAQIDFRTRAKSPLEVLKQIEKYYITNLPHDLGKLTLGLSWYGDNLNPKIINQTLLKIKSRLKKFAVSVRLLPTTEPALSTATSHHNGLGKNPKKIEIIVAQNHQEFVIGRSIGCQNISAYRDRDQKRPKRDSKVGMLPPKLAQMMVNLSRPQDTQTDLTLLDPFCGTGVILQEAHLLGFNVIGSDIEPRMVNYSKQNLAWIDKDTNKAQFLVGDATHTKWPKFDCVASESYLGKPFGTPPTLTQIRSEKELVEPILTGFLRNLRQQLPAQGQICLAIPAWLKPDGNYEDLNLTQAKELARLGFQYRSFNLIHPQDLIYYRPGQSVARRLLVLQKF